MYNVHEAYMLCDDVTNVTFTSLHLKVIMYCRDLSCCVWPIQAEFLEAKMGINQQSDP